MKGFLLLSGLLATTASAHMQMKQPYPIRSPLNKNATGKIDYSYTNSLLPSGQDYPCKGYQNDPFVSEANYTPGQSYEMELEGEATHGGGSCQLALTYDKGKTFKVIESMLGECPIPKKYKFTVPSDAPSGEALLAWTWFNKIGNREMYMNCAMVTIGGDSSRKMGNSADMEKRESIDMPSMTPEEKDPEAESDDDHSSTTQVSSSKESTSKTTDTTTTTTSSKEKPTSSKSTSKKATDKPTETSTTTEKSTSTKEPEDKPTETSTSKSTSKKATDKPTETSTTTEKSTSTKQPEDKPTETSTSKSTSKKATDKPTETSTTTEKSTSTKQPEDKPTETSTSKSTSKKATDKPTETPTTTEKPTSTKPKDKPTETPNTKQATAFKNLPELFVANVNQTGQCVTIEGETVDFPEPGDNVMGKSEGKGFKCSGNAPFLGAEAPSSSSDDSGNGKDSSSKDKDDASKGKDDSKDSSSSSKDSSSKDSSSKDSSSKDSSSKDSSSKDSSSKDSSSKDSSSKDSSSKDSSSKDKGDDSKSKDDSKDSDSSSKDSSSKNKGDDSKSKDDSKDSDSSSKADSSKNKEETRFAPSLTMTKVAKIAKTRSTPKSDPRMMGTEAASGEFHEYVGNWYCYDGEFICSPDGLSWAQCDHGYPVYMGPVARGTLCRGGRMVDAGDWN
ncbi:hypothetical protein N7474_007637 [Penicillium riverlandense]|uniref:uncharacterized protein n=1 Tax=Penicillium riverlandense TaxID=1903569 RepID=UPI00254734D5|nr:uncharacterized protein N7474_007637 [Penicillium riverlandense]KAJ5811336.1 hypothetical protein N7474_007637 [Penicillium riverlandense]